MPQQTHDGLEDSRDRDARDVNDEGREKRSAERS
jgi:hypothetical protein